MISDVLVALIGLGGVIWTTTVGYFLTQAKKQKLQLSDKDKRISLLKKEAAFERESASTLVSLQEWDSVSSRIQNFCASSTISRFLILVAVNGANDPREATAIFQHRPDMRDFQSYVGIGLDRDYVMRLAELRREGHITIRTKDLPSCLLKSIYLTEGVQYAVWYLIGTMTSSDTDQVAYKYCSFATHESSISEDTARSINNIVGELKKLLGRTNYNAY